MSEICTHLSLLEHDATAVADGCVECLAAGGRWLHLRRCVTCGHIGCCDQSPGRHATAHFHEVGHPLLQSFEPGEDWYWYWCFADELLVEVDADVPSRRTRDRSSPDLKDPERRVTDRLGGRSVGHGRSPVATSPRLATRPRMVGSTSAARCC